MAISAWKLSFATSFDVHLNKEDVPEYNNINLLQHTCLKPFQTEPEEIYAHVFVCE